MRMTSFGTVSNVNSSEIHIILSNVGMHLGVECKICPQQ